MPLATQRYLFDYFSATLDATIKVARGEGKYESGIEVLSEKSCVTVESEEVVHVDRSSGAKTFHLELEVDDGLSWDTAVKERDECIARMKAEGVEDKRISKVGFYVSRWTSNFNNSGHPLVVLATEVPKRFAENKIIYFRLLRPNQCTANVFSSWDLSAKYEMTQMSDEVMKAHWTFWYDTLGKKGAGNARGGGCMHGPNCKVRKQTGSCQYGSRLYKKYLVTGAVLPVIQKVFEASKSDEAKGVAKALRTNTVNGKLLVGLSLTRADSEDFRLACQ
jgi:hypothetical protein